MRDNEIQLLLSVWKNAGGKRERKRCGCKCCKSRKCCSQCCRSYRGIYEKSGSHLVCCSSEGRWNAQIQHQGKKYYLGSYQTREEAALEYDRAALKFHGENAVCNFNGTSKSQPQGTESQPPPPAASSVDVANILMSLRAIDTSSLPRPELRHYNTRRAARVSRARCVQPSPSQAPEESRASHSQPSARHAGCASRGSRPSEVEGGRFGEQGGREPRAEAAESGLAPLATIFLLVFVSRAHASSPLFIGQHVPHVLLVAARLRGFVSRGDEGDGREAEGGGGGGQRHGKGTRVFGVSRIVV